MPKSAQPQAVVIPAEVEEELTLLRGFRDLVAERTGYFLGSRVLTKTMNEETAEERKAVREAGKALREAISTLIAEPNNGNAQTVKDLQGKVKEAKENAKKAREPHMKKISPLRKAVRYIDTVAVPDSLKELGKDVVPIFSLSDWINKAIAPKK